jgi:CRP-like cAMP-binding protein
MTLTHVGGPRTLAPPAADNADLFAEDVIRAAAAIRLPSLVRTPPPGTLYHVFDRHGVSVVAVPTTSLSPGQIDALLRFRFAQYLDIGFVDRRLAALRGLRAEPADAVGPGDLHVIAAAASSGEILCYAVIEQPPATPAGCRLRADRRALFPVEQVHGAGVFNRLPILPDLAVAKVREMGRFVRNQRPTAGRDLVTRAVVETGVALFRLIAGPLSLHVDAVVGDLEEHVAKTNLDYFHVPSVVVHVAVPYTDAANVLSPRYRLHTVYPFALLTSDIAAALPRLQQIEQALSHPGKRALLALARLRSRGAPSPSMLCPSQHADPPDELCLVQADTSMPQRGDLLRRGGWLRSLPAFSGLSRAEAALLGSHMQQIDVSAGHLIARQGESADALHVVQRGHATVRLADDGATDRLIESLRPGACCGQVAILPGAQHPADVVAVTDMTLLRLSKADHDAYLAHLPEIAAFLSGDALRLLTRIDQHRRERATACASVEACPCGDDCACLGHDHTTTTTPGADQTSTSSPSGGDLR